MNSDLYNKIIFKKYKVTKRIGYGSFGSVFKGKNIINNELVAIKVEDWKAKGDVLESEVYFLFYLKNFGIPEIKSFGVYKKYKILVQTLLGENLEQIFVSKLKNLSQKDICMVFIQLLDRLEYIHSKYVIHRDLKPENIMIDLESKKIIYLIDFGMAKKYRSGKTKRHIKFSIPSRFTGTARYCSINALRGTEQSRRDDLESAGYVMIYLAQKGYLPWIGLTNPDKLERYRQIYRIKKGITEEKLCQFLPSAFREYMKYVKNLIFEEDPNYNYMRGLFINLLSSFETKNDLKFSWIINKKNKEKENPNNQRNHFLKKKGSPQERILKQIQTCQEKEKKIDNIKTDELSDILEKKQEKRDYGFLSIKKNNELNEASYKNKNEESIQQSPRFNAGYKENSHDEKIQENKKCDDGATQIAQLNMPILVDDFDENNKSNDNQKKIGEYTKKENKNINVNINLNKNYNNVNEDDNKENNVFIFDNDSFKGVDEREKIPQSRNRYINNINIYNQNDSSISQEEKNNKINQFLDKNRYIYHSTQDIFSPQRNIDLIKRTNPKTNNMNKGKVINITNKYNRMIESKSGLSDENKFSGRRNNIKRQQLNNWNLKNIEVDKKTNLKKITLNKISYDNNNNNYNDISNPYYYMIPKSSDIDFVNNKNNNSTKTAKTINSYDFIKRPNSKRNAINYNIMNSKSNEMKYYKILPRIIKNFNHNDKILIHNNSAKEMRSMYSKNNYYNIKNRNMAIRTLYDTVNTNENMNSIVNPNTLRIKKTKILQINYMNNNMNKNNKLLKNKKLNHILFAKNRENPNNNLLKMNLYPIKQIVPKYNNNVINNITYSVNLVHKDTNRRLNNSHSYRSKNNIYNSKILKYPGLKRIKINKIGIKNLSPINIIDPTDKRKYTSQNKNNNNSNYLKYDKINNRYFY